MKNLSPSIFCLLLLFSCIRPAAQESTVKESVTDRLSLFEQLSQRTNCHINDFVSLLESSDGKQVSIQKADNLQFDGTVSSVATKSENTEKNIVIRSGNIAEVALTFSKITNDNGSLSFAGRIICFLEADGYKITFENSKYIFVNKTFMTCSMINQPVFDPYPSTNSL